MTDNAVRAHLLSLQRDGLVRQSGTQQGSRKPHFAYELTSEAERLFPKAYDVLLTRLITVLKGRLATDVAAEILRDVGRSLASDHVSEQPGGGVERRLERALSVMDALGGSSSFARKDGRAFNRSGSCPLGAAVAEHPEVCRLAETLLAEVVGAPVQERCEREQAPRCRFEIAGTAAP